MISFVNNLRMHGFNVDMDYNSRNLKNNFARANKLNAKFVAIIGDDEIKNDYITIKNNNTKEEFKIKTEKIVDFLDEKLGEENEN